jgi:hypothetical protein
LVIHAFDKRIQINCVCLLILASLLLWWWRLVVLMVVVGNTYPTCAFFNRIPHGFTTWTHTTEMQTAANMLSEEFMESRGLEVLACSDSLLIHAFTRTLKILSRIGIRQVMFATIYMAAWHKHKLDGP